MPWGPKDVQREGSSSTIVLVVFLLFQCLDSILQVVKEVVGKVRFQVAQCMDRGLVVKANDFIGRVVEFRAKMVGESFLESVTEIERRCGAYTSLVH